MNYLSLIIKTFTVNNYYLPLMKIFTVNKNNNGWWNLLTVNDISFLTTKSHLLVLYFSYFHLNLCTTQRNGFSVPSNSTINLNIIFGEQLLVFFQYLISFISYWIFFSLLVVWNIWKFALVKVTSYLVMRLNFLSFQLNFRRKT